MAKFPHCDANILHAPGKCKYCDMHPIAQLKRLVQKVAFTGTPEELGTEELQPCPSTANRPPEVRDLWYGNVAKPETSE